MARFSEVTITGCRLCYDTKIMHPSSTSWEYHQTCLISSLPDLAPDASNKTRYIKAIVPGLKIAMTMRDLASGDRCASMKFDVRVSRICSTSRTSLAAPYSLKNSVSISRCLHVDGTWRKPQNSGSRWVSSTQNIYSAGYMIEATDACQISNWPELKECQVEWTTCIRIQPTEPLPNDDMACCFGWRCLRDEEQPDKALLTTQDDQRAEDLQTPNI